jgi:signal transduction histidine kinase
MRTRTSEVEENRDAFLAAISHELKTPLAGLRVSAQLLRRKFEADEELDLQSARRLIEIVNVQADKLTKLLSYLLDVSRSGPGSIPLERQETDLVALAGDLVCDTQARTTRHDIRVDGPTDLWAMVDAARIEQVLVNLLDNAVKYSPDGGAIEIALSRIDRGTVSMAVRDHGIGIPVEHREQMFDRFSDAHDHRLPGLGLGLFLSRRLVELHGGTVSAEFPPDGGTRVVVVLPRGVAASPPAGLGRA